MQAQIRQNQSPVNNWSFTKAPGENARRLVHKAMKTIWQRREGVAWGLEYMGKREILEPIRAEKVMTKAWTQGKHKKGGEHRIMKINRKHIQKHSDPYRRGDVWSCQGQMTLDTFTNWKRQKRKGGNKYSNTGHNSYSEEPERQICVGSRKLYWSNMWYLELTGIQNELENHFPLAVFWILTRAKCHPETSLLTTEHTL